MKYYIEITLINNADIGMYTLWGQVYSQLHLALVETQDDQGKVSVGVSFPEYIYNPADQHGFLGSKLRIFAIEESILERLNLAKWLSRLSDYVHLTGIRVVPERITGYALYQRQQLKSSAERLARRYAKRHDGFNLEQALPYYIGKEQNTGLPYIQLQSLSNEHQFRLFIAKQQVEKSSFQEFGTYGLSSVSTVPEF